MGTQKTIYNLYLATVYKGGMITLVCACLCADVFYIALKLLGLYPVVSWTTLAVFIVMDLCFVAIAAHFIHQSYNTKGINAATIKKGKIFAYLVMIIQWNYILYMMPLGTFWGFLFFFVTLVCFFLDIKLAVMVGVSCFLSMMLSWLLTGRNPIYQQNEWPAADFIAMVTSIVLSLTAIVILIRFMTQVQWLYEKSERQLNIQQSYYKEFIRRENGIQQFRHDIRKHINAMNALCQENDWAALTSYISKLSGELQQNSYVGTGNTIANIFVNELIDDEQKKPGFTWNVTGTFPPMLKIDEADFCVIFANAIENVKEALDKMDGERFFSLVIRNYHEQIYMTISNSANHPDVKKGTVNLNSQKPDFQNHGYGLQNIKSIVAANGGRVNWKCENRIFTMEIEL